MMTAIINFFGDEKYLKIRRRSLITVLVIILMADMVVSRDHGEFFWDHLPLWWGGFGFISCVVIIFVSKALGHQGRIMRDEDYYD